MAMKVTEEEIEEILVTMEMGQMGKLGILWISEMGKSFLVSGGLQVLFWWEC